MGHVQQLCEILSRSNLAVRIYDPGKDFDVQFDRDIRDMTLGQGHDTPLHHGQLVCELLTRVDLAAMSYGRDTDI